MTTTLRRILTVPLRWADRQRHRAVAPRLLSATAIAAVLAMPAVMLADCAPPSPTIASQPIYSYAGTKTDGSPDLAMWGVWGAAGWVEGEVYCTTTDGQYLAKYDSGPVWFPGGGNSLHPAYFLKISCSWFVYPNVLVGSGVAWSWT